MNDNELRSWDEQFALEMAYSRAESCLNDAKFVSGEREYYGIFALVDDALRNLKVIGRIANINGQKRLEAAE